MRTARQIYYSRINNSIIMNTYQKYVASAEDNDPQYVVDTEGTLHDLSGNIKAKLDKVEKSWRYWEERLSNDTADKQAIRFVKKFKHLSEQIHLFLDVKEQVAHI